MRISDRPAWSSETRAVPPAGTRGAVMMFVLLAALLIAAVTLTVMALTSSSTAAGVRQQQAVQVFNIAEAGVHYAIATLEGPGAGSYAGGTLPVMSGSTVLGTAAITVNCADTGAAPPCSGANAAYRRIVSVGTLPVAGPTRTIVAILQATTGTSYAYCAYQGFTGQSMNVASGDIGSNGNITLQSSSIGGSIRNDGSQILQNTTAAGSAQANSTITCQSCTVSGGMVPFAGLPTVCPGVSVGPFAPGSGSVTVMPGNTLTLTSSGAYGDITLMSGSCPNYTNLVLQAGGAGTTTVIQANSITMQNCSRVQVSGAGAVTLLLGSAGTGLTVQGGRFGAGSADTYASPQRVPAGQLTVQANGGVTLQSPDYVSATFLVPNGTFIAQTANNVYGAIVTKTTIIQSSFGLAYDPSATTGYSNFSQLRSWKDK
jgi:hypothetical protein